VAWSSWYTDMHTYIQRFLAEQNMGRFVMFTVITNIYNKKTKGSTLMELFTETGKLKKFFLTTRDVRCVHHEWRGTHGYDIQVLATHASTWVHRYFSLLQWYVPIGQNLNIVSMCAVLPVVHTSNISSCKINFALFLWLWTIPLGRSFGFLVINICNRGEHYETPYMISNPHHQLQSRLFRKSNAVCFQYKMVVLNNITL
jgi:hypothetical protein